MFNAISGITYTPPVAYPQSDYMLFFNEALSAGYGAEEARKIAKEKVQKQKEDKIKKRKVEDTDKSKQPKQHIDRRA